jgi:hypothetical protein
MLERRIKKPFENFSDVDGDVISDDKQFRASLLQNNLMTSFFLSYTLMQAVRN